MRVFYGLLAAGGVIWMVTAASEENWVASGGLFVFTMICLWRMEQVPYPNPDD